MTLASGSRLGPYEIAAPLGAPINTPCRPTASVSSFAALTEDFDTEPFRVLLNWWTKAH